LLGELLASGAVDEIDMPLAIHPLGSNTFGVEAEVGT
jgi:hypothetical protein